MKIVFCSNYFNRHQKALCDELFALCDGDFTFVETAPMREERRKMGYEIPRASYVLRTFESEDEASEVQKRILEADAVIHGSAPETLLRERKRASKLVLRYAERPLRGGKEILKYLPRLLVWHLRNPQKKPFYLLCASAYTAADFSRFFLYKNRAFRFGYFPAFSEKMPSETPRQKTAPRLLFCARLIELKHPELVLNAAKRLSDEGYDFLLDFIGDGESKAALQECVQEYDLQARVRFLGTLPQESVREHMNNAEIFLFTSDRREGWGAVLWEAMESGLAVLASHAAGSTPFLVQNGKNGLIFQSENEEDFYRKLRRLLEDDALCKTLGTAARQTISSEWNARVAAERLLTLCRALLCGEDANALFSEGPCSPSPILSDDWFTPYE